MGWVCLFCCWRKNAFILATLIMTSDLCQFRWDFTEKRQIGVVRAAHCTTAHTFLQVTRPQKGCTWSVTSHCASAKSHKMQLMALANQNKAVALFWECYVGKVFSGDCWPPVERGLCRKNITPWTHQILLFHFLCVCVFFFARSFCHI